MKVFHGSISPMDFARALEAEFNRTNLKTQKFGNPDDIILQIGSKRHARSGGQTALTVTIEKVEDGVSVQLGNQSWLGVAASLGKTALSTISNPFSLLGRLDDLAQDIENINLSDRIWEIIEKTSQSAGASHRLSERFRRLICTYCDTPNEIKDPSCLACGAPLGDSQPVACTNCGFVNPAGASTCENCESKL